MECYTNSSSLGERGHYEAINLVLLNTTVITNISTSLYEIQSQYEIGSLEFEEINKRLKLCCKQQSATIDNAKGVKTKEFPKWWYKYNNPEKCTENIDTVNFNNSILADKRPYFMKYLYPSYKLEYRKFRKDFDNYGLIVFGKTYEEIKAEYEECPTTEYKEYLEYYKQKNPLLETNGTMNRICYYMENQLKDFTKLNIDKTISSQNIFTILFNPEYEIEEGSAKFNQMLDLLRQYNNFKVNKALASSEYNTYEQFYKSLRKQALEQISSNIEELANYAVYICYSYYPNKPKDFLWDVFGKGIVKYLISKNPQVELFKLKIDPEEFNSDDVEYLYQHFERTTLNLTQKEELVNEL